MVIYAKKDLPLPMKEGGYMKLDTKPTDTEKARQGITLTKFYGNDYICCMATFIGAISKSKGSSKAQIVKSLKTILSELNKLDNIADFRNVYITKRYLSEVERVISDTLIAVERDN